MKVCSRCKIEKEESRFSRKKGGKNGLTAACKECVFEYNKKYRIDHPSAVKLWEKRKREKNKDKIRESRKKHYEKNKKAIVAKNKEWVIDNIEKVKKKREAYYKSENGRAKQKNWVAINRHRVVASQKKCTKKGREEIRDVYIKKLLLKKYSKEQIEEIPAILDIKKLEILIYRANKLKKQKS